MNFRRAPEFLSCQLYSIAIQLQVYTECILGRALENRLGCGVETIPQVLEDSGSGEPVPEPGIQLFAATGYALWLDEDHKMTTEFL